MPGEIFIVHSLEHGRMEIQYSPELPEEDQLALKGLYDTMYGGTLLFPNENMDYEVAATTWTNLMGCPEYKGAITLDAIRDFGKATWGRYGGEPVDRLRRSRRARPRSNPKHDAPASCPLASVGGEEAARVASGREAVVGLAVADDLRGVPGLLAVGEAALELLQRGRRGRGRRRG